jgi:PAS domain S-box-containing protein
MSTRLYPSPLLRYLVAVFTVGLALVLRLVLTPVVGMHSPFLFFILPVAISAWFGGIGPGLVATGLALVAVDYFFLPPIHSLLAYTLAVKIRVAFFALESTTVSAIVGALKNAIYRGKVDLALHQSQEQLRLLIESIEDYSIVMLDTEGNVMTWNHGAEQLMGYKSSEIVGRHFSVFFTGQDAGLAEPEGALRMAAASEKWKGEYWRIRKDGSRFRAHVVITALKDRSGELRGYAEIARDAGTTPATEDSLLADRHLS